MALVAGSLMGAMPPDAYTGQIWSPYPLPPTPSVPGGPTPPGSAAIKAPREPGAARIVPFRPGGTSWPSSGSGTTALSSPLEVRHGRLQSTSAQIFRGWQRVGSLPVRVSAVPGEASASVGSVGVRVAAHSAAARAGLADGVLFDVSDTSDAAGPVRLRMSYAGFGGMFGGSWEWRLHLVRLPSCALTDPGRAACRTMTPVSSENDSGGRYVAATVPVGGPSRGTVLALISGVSGPTGAFSATSLRSSGTWAEQQGAFTYSYPVTMPPALAGAAPDVSLSYDSQSIDSETSGANTQGGMIGDGWDFTPGFIERSYQPCSQDGIAKSGDLCWGGYNATLSLGGRSTPLVFDDSTKAWHPQNDDGTSVQLLQNASNGLWNGEYWLVTTSDGTQYYFGLDHFPTGNGSDTSSQAAWGEPVYNPNKTDPCYQASAGSSSECFMGWRWNLDYVVDPQLHLTQYVYNAETNYYQMGGGQGTGTLTQYDRGGYLTQLKYGFLLPDAIAGANPAVLVNFGYSLRCLNSAATCNANHDAADWPDVPWDQSCASSGSCINVSPTFWSTERLTSITTKALESGTYTAVDKYALTQTFPNGAGSQPVMFLNSITRTGEDSTSGSGTPALPAVTFNPTEFDNRVDGLVINGKPSTSPVDRPRISGIITELGGAIAVNYASAGCSRTNSVMPANAYTNTLPCFPVYWTPPGQTQIQDWFLKYLVSEVTESDGTSAGSPALEWRYSYMGNVAWHYDNNPLVPAANRTWDEYRGFQQIKTLTGAPGDPVQQTIQTYMQGMDGDNNGTGGTRTVKVADTVGDNITDNDWLAGQVLETDTYTQSGGSIVKKVVNGPWTYNQTASQAESGGLPALTAHMVAHTQTQTMELFTGSNWDTDTVNTYYNSDDLVAAVDQDPDGSAETCTSTNYANPPTGSSGNSMMENYPDQVTVVTGGYASGACPAVTKADLVSNAKTYYDDPSSTLTSLGTLGNLNFPGGQVTGISKVASYTSQQNWQPQSATSYDSLGRVTAITTPTPAGATGTATVTTGYTPAYVTGQTTELPTQITVTKPHPFDNFVTTTTYDQGREQPLTVIDLNGEKTTETYDELGRLTSVTTPQDQASGDATEMFSYSVPGPNPTTGVFPPSAVTTQALREDGTYGVDVQISDGMGQERQEQSTPANDGAGRVITDTFYNSDGWAVKVHNPYYNTAAAPGTSLFKPTQGDGAIPSWTATTYDGLGRVTSRTFNSGSTQQWSTTTSYPAMNQTDVNPPSGSTATSTFTNILGQTTATWQYTDVTAPNDNPADADATGYTYTPAGQVNTVSDDADNTWTYSYDLLGHTISESDPGTTQSATSTYDAAGNIATTTDPDGNELSYKYDLLGRKTAVYSGSLTTGTVLDSWTYDQTVLGNGPAKALGQLSSSISNDSYGGESGGPYTEKVTGYTAAYQATGTSTTIPAADLVPGGSGNDTFTTTNTYTPLTGLLQSEEFSPDQGLPDETVNYSYGLEGELDATGGNTAYLDQTIYDPFGNVQRTTYGLYGQQLSRTFTEDPATHWLVGSTIDLQTYSQSGDSNSYAYNEAGDLTAASDVQITGGTRTQCYKYNDQQELTAAWTDTGGLTTDAAPMVSGIGGCTHASPVSTNIGGPGPYWEGFSYDALGDRTSATFNDTSGNTSKNVVQTLTYPGNGTTQATQPNAPTSIVTQYGTTGSKDTTTPSYDAAGNTTAQTTTTTGSSPPPAPPAESGVTYNPFGLTATVMTSSGTSGYTYDASGNLLLQTDPATSSAPASTTLYLDGGAEQITYTAATASTAADVVATRFYVGTDGSVIARSFDNNAPLASATTLSYLPSSPQGTATDSITDDTHQVMTRRYYDPYGVQTGGSLSWPDNLGFVNRPADAVTSLDLLGARQYEPVTGRFLSLDPLFESGSPQSMGGYSYAADNPATQADPTGQCPCLTDGSTDRKDPNTGSYGDPGGGETGGGYWGSTGSYGGTGQAPGTSLLPPAARQGFQAFYKKFVVDNYDRGSYLELDALANYCGRSTSESLCGPSMTFKLVFDRLSALSHLGLIESPMMEGGAGMAALRSSEFETIDNDLAALAGDDTAALCGGQSFTGGTKVLLANGTTIRISKLKPGDKVLATNVKTGKTRAETVTAVLIHHDTNLYNLTIRTKHGTATIHTTTTHLFWTPHLRYWESANKLSRGEHLKTADGTVAVVGGKTPTQRNGWMWDLTVQNDHDFYVEPAVALPPSRAGPISVLVHNENCGPMVLGISQHSDALASKLPGGYTFNGDEYAQVVGQVNGKPIAQWQVEINNVLKSNGKVAISLGGMDGATPAEQFMNAYDAGSGDNWRATEWEMYQVGRQVQRGNLTWGNVTFYNGAGEVVNVPKPAGW
jgi:RHS repeat-associated protein